MLEFILQTSLTKAKIMDFDSQIYKCLHSMLELKVITAVILSLTIFYHKLYSEIYIGIGIECLQKWKQNVCFY